MRCRFSVPPEEWSGTEVVADADLAGIEREGHGLIAGCARCCDVMVVARSSAKGGFELGRHTLEMPIPPYYFAFRDRNYTSICHSSPAPFSISALSRNVLLTAIVSSGRSPETTWVARSSLWPSTT
jgi:hypothetical protein